MKPHRRRPKNERGNVLFYILIAVALLAALSFVVAHNGRGGNVQQLSKERARLQATEIIEFGNIMSAAVAQLRLRGVKDSELCFDHAAWGAANYNHTPACDDNLNRLFHPAGGGVVWSMAQSEAMDPAAAPDNLWHIYADNEIQDVGETCGAAACADLILVLDELAVEVCQQINGLLGITDAAAAPPTDTAMGETRYVGVFAYAQTLGDEAGGAAFRGKTAACFQKTGAPAEYVFYRVLRAR